MKIMTVIIASLLLVISSTHTYSYDMFDKNDSFSKDECLLFAKKCENEIETIKKKIMELQSEIQKGSVKYNIEDINKLKEKLDETYEMLDSLTSH